MTAIAVIKLADGEVTYFDPKTGVRLTQGSPYATIDESMDITNIRKSVRLGRLSLVQGLLPAADQGYDKIVNRIIKSTKEEINSGIPLKDFDEEAALREADAQLAEVQKEIELREKETAVLIEDELMKVEAEITEEDPITLQPVHPDGLSLDIIDEVEEEKEEETKPSKKGRPSKKK